MIRAVLLAALLAAHAGCGAAFGLSATPLPTVFAGPAEGTSSWVPGRPRSARPAASARACETRPTAGPGQARESRRDIIHKTGSAAATLLLVPAAAGAADFARVRGLPSFHSLAPAAGARLPTPSAVSPSFAHSVALRRGSAGYRDFWVGRRRAPVLRRAVGRQSGQDHGQKLHR